MTTFSWCIVGICLTFLGGIAVEMGRHLGRVLAAKWWGAINVAHYLPSPLYVHLTGIAKDSYK